MNLYVNQNINIHSIRIDGISNSSVLQIGSAGMIKPLSQLYNTGGFTQAAPQAAPGAAPGAAPEAVPEATPPEGPVSPIPFIPLTPPAPATR
jgi:spore germination protein PB